MQFVRVSLLCLVTLASTKPIMVSFGTNQGPIIPKPKSATLEQRTIVTRSPAPVSEEREDVPNPNQYKPLIPHQYRSKLYSFKPSANLILGTPLDQKYTPSIQKYNLQRKQYAKNLNLGVDYTGPHIFDKQEYEIYEAKKNLLKYKKPHFYRQIEKRNDDQADNASGNKYNSKYVPQIGIIYSAGVRYYVPQIVYYNQQQKSENPEEENSVYDAHDVKYYH
ncbi:hypothetical protein NQ314_000387 [Rhamnusium bicolor]|uniref:Uncharacterized protein n=1 Tax=Rhamnusium bicolor TaxID=1586634 RepID=A0AAV8ZYC6_9CUCU|nr:hypothetical protein NQ314_000387 [Rhamnusium bicolor]